MTTKNDRITTTTMPQQQGRPTTNDDHRARPEQGHDRPSTMQAREGEGWGNDDENRMAMMTMTGGP